MSAAVKRGDRGAGCRCRYFEIDLYDEDDEPIPGWYGPKCPHHSPVEILDSAPPSAPPGEDTP